MGPHCMIVSTLYYEPDLRVWKSNVMEAESLWDKVISLGDEARFHELAAWHLLHRNLLSCIMHHGLGWSLEDFNTY
jgi:hypothetical protein